MSQPRFVHAANLPKPVGPYSPGAIFGRLIFVSGQGATDPATGRLAGDDVETQTEQCLKNVRAILQAAGSDLQHVLQLADEAMLFYAVEVDPGVPDWGPEVIKALKMLNARLSTVSWERAAISEAIKEVVKSSGLKMPQLAMPLRRLVTGRTQTPSIDAVLELIGRETVLLRLSRHLNED